MKSLPIHLRVDTIMCGICGKLIHKIQDDTWNDDMSFEAYKKRFPNGKPEDMTAICIDCFDLLAPGDGSLQDRVINIPLAPNEKTTTEECSCDPMWTAQCYKQGCKECFDCGKPLPPKPQ